MTRILIVFLMVMLVIPAMGQIDNFDDKPDCGTRELDELLESGTIDEYNRTKSVFSNLGISDVDDRTRRELAITATDTIVRYFEAEYPECKEFWEAKYHNGLAVLISGFMVPFLADVVNLVGIDGFQEELLTLRDGLLELHANETFLGRRALLGDEEDNDNIPEYLELRDCRDFDYEDFVESGAWDSHLAILERLDAIDIEKVDDAARESNLRILIDAFFEINELDYARCRELQEFKFHNRVALTLAGLFIAFNADATDLGVADDMRLDFVVLVELVTAYQEAELDASLDVIGDHVE